MTVPRSVLNFSATRHPPLRSCALYRLDDRNHLSRFLSCLGAPLFVWGTYSNTREICCVVCHGHPILQYSTSVRAHIIFFCCCWLARLRLVFLKEFFRRYATGRTRTSRHVSESAACTGLLSDERAARHSHYSSFNLSSHFCLPAFAMPCHVVLVLVCLPLHFTQTRTRRGSTAHHGTALGMAS